MSNTTCVILTITYTRGTTGTVLMGKGGDDEMKNQVILSESDIVQTIANSFCVDKKDVDFRHYKETIGYGYSEEEIDRVEVTVTLPINEVR